MLLLAVSQRRGKDVPAMSTERGKLREQNCWEQLPGSHLNRQQHPPLHDIRWGRVKVHEGTNPQRGERRQLRAAAGEAASASTWASSVSLGVPRGGKEERCCATKQGEAVSLATTSTRQLARG